MHPFPPPAQERVYRVNPPPQKEAHLRSHGIRVSALGVPFDSCAIVRPPPPPQPSYVSVGVPSALPLFVPLHYRWRMGVCFELESGFDP